MSVGAEFWAVSLIKAKAPLPMCPSASQLEGVNFIGWSARSDAMV